MHYTKIGTQDYALDSTGVAVGFADRVEVSIAAQDFHGTAAALNGVHLKQDIFGVKVRVAGDAVYDQDTWMPQLAVGVQAKQNKGITGLAGVTSVKQLGAKSETGTDVYLAATKIYLQQSLLLNATLRMTKANQMGLIGFGGDKSDSYKPMLEASAAYLLNRHLAIGAEYRQKPNNLNVDNEKAYADVFVAFFPTKNVSVTAAYASLGDITVLNNKQQSGYYLSLQAGF